MKAGLKILVFTSVMFISFGFKAQTDNKPNIFLITLDGARWQDVFTGIDTILLKSDYTKERKFLTEKFVGNSNEENRMLLMPFFWNTIAKKGQLHGNRYVDSKVNLTNTMAFSYPGYNEILTGKADDENVNSNDKNYNKNVTILEKANSFGVYKNNVAAFCSWDVFPFIINDKRSGIPVNAGYMDAVGELNSTEKFLNEIQRQAPIIWESVRLDVFTHHFAKEYVKKNKPKLLYVSYGETDDFAHEGMFDFYIKSLHNTDALIKDLWDYVQNDSFYKNNTYFIITTDHGRGTGIEQESIWTSHGDNVKGADETWIAVIGPNVEALGEGEHNQFYTNQIAATIAKIIGLNISDPKMGKPIKL